MLEKQKSTGSNGSPAANNEIVEDLVKMGFEKSRVIEALSICDGNKEHAATYLLGSSMKF